jgi:hypothetical protein
VNCGIRRPTLRMRCLFGSHAAESADALPISGGLPIQRSRRAPSDGATVLSRGAVRPALAKAPAIPSAVCAPLLPRASRPSSRGPAATEVRTPIANGSTNASGGQSGMADSAALIRSADASGAMSPMKAPMPVSEPARYLSLSAARRGEVTWSISLT